MSEARGVNALCHPSITPGCPSCEVMLDRRLAFQEEQLEALETDHQTAVRMVQVAERHVVEAREKVTRARLSVEEMRRFHAAAFAGQDPAEEEVA